MNEINRLDKLRLYIVYPHRPFIMIGDVIEYIRIVPYTIKGEEKLDDVIITVDGDLYHFDEQAIKRQLPLRVKEFERTTIAYASPTNPFIDRFTYDLV